jgi:probable HAF family extracellular repeat protein
MLKTVSGITLLISLTLTLYAQDYKPTSLPSLGGSHTQGASMNASGQVVGMSRTAAGQTHAFLWSRQDGMVDLDLLIGQFLRPLSINASGTIAGLLGSHAAI